MNRSNVAGLRRLLTNMKESSRAHAEILSSLPVIATRKESIQLKFQFRTDGSAGRKRTGKVGRLKESL